MRICIVTVLLLLGWPQSGQGKEIFLCYDEEVPTFSDLPCSNAQRLSLKPAQTVRQAPFTAAEQRQLQSLASRVKQLAAKRALQQQRQLRSRARSAAERQQRCAQVRSELKLLSNQRRQGYTLRSAKELDGRAATLRSEEQANC